MQKKKKNTVFHIMFQVFQGSKLVGNSSSVTSNISVYNLKPQTHYRLILWSANTHGASRRTILDASTVPTNTSTSSSMNGHDITHHQEGPGPRGIMSKLGPSILAVVVVVTVLGVVMGVVLGILTKRIEVPGSDECDECDEPPTPDVFTSRARVPMARIGESRRYDIYF